MSDILARLRGYEYEPVTDGKSRSMRSIVKDAHEAADEIVRLRRLVDESVEALQELYDWQNGPPLISWKDLWQGAMAKSEAVLKQASIRAAAVGQGGKP